MLRLGVLVLFVSQWAVAKDCKYSMYTDSKVGIMAFSEKEIKVGEGCTKLTIEYTNKSGMPKSSFGHNVILGQGSEAEITALQTQHGAKFMTNADYVPKDDKILAVSPLTGGNKKDAKGNLVGETVSVSLDLAKVDPKKPLWFFCAFAGHIAMKGKVILPTKPSKS